MVFVVVTSSVGTAPSGQLAFPLSSEHCCWNTFPFDTGALLFDSFVFSCFSITLNVLPLLFETPCSLGKELCFNFIIPVLEAGWLVLSVLDRIPLSDQKTANASYFHRKPFKNCMLRKFKDKIKNKSVFPHGRRHGIYCHMMSFLVCGNIFKPKGKNCLPSLWI